MVINPESYNMAVSMKNIYSFLPDELIKELDNDIPKFRIKQIYNWLYVKYISNFDDMTNLPKGLIQTLKDKFSLSNLKIIKIEQSQDGTKKYLFKTKDGHSFESVLLKMKEKETDECGKIIHEEKYTLCLSSQIGCKVGCAFCYTAKGGFVRNLEAGEIVEQVVSIKRDNNIRPEKGINIVYMGMGEPLDNFDNLLIAIQILSNLNGLSISAKRQTISTSGIATKIEKLGKLNLGVQLAISLHAVNDELRSRLIPMNKAYNIQQILDQIKKFPIDARKRIMFEYLMIKDVNDDLTAAKSLLRLLNGIKAKVNLIRFNHHEGSIFKSPSDAKIKDFANFLISKGLLATIRESKGADISAACGQLREKNNLSTQ